MNIRLNNAPYTTSAETYQDLKDASDLLADMLIVNGHSKAWDTHISQDDNVIMLDSKSTPSISTWRAIYDARYGKEIMDKLQAGKVAICGLGGLGSLIAIELGRLGVGSLLLIDYDVVEPTNLARQQFNFSHIGLNKTDAVANQLAEIAPLTKVTTKNIRLTHENIVEILHEYPYVCEAVDKPETKALLTQIILSKCPNTTIIGGSGMAGHGPGNAIQAKRILPRLYMVGDGESEGEEGIGLMAPRVGLCASAQATLIMRLLLNDI